MSVSLTTLSGYAVEESSAVISVAITDENDVAAIPVTLSWTLTDVNGAVINSRENVSVAVPAATNYIALSGDDLAITENTHSVVRVFTVEGTFTSALTGGTLPFKDSVRFEIKNLVAV